MSGRNDKREGEEEGWESTFLKVACAAAAAATVAGGLYALFKQPEPEAAQALTGTVTAQIAQRPNKEVWTKPRRGWLKLNVDGSLLPDPLSAGCGGVLRDSSGKWISGFAVKLEPRRHYPDETEKEAIFRGLRWARGRRVKKVVVESDNRGIVNLVKNGSRTINPLICQIRDLLSSGDWKAKLSWIPGNANGVADKLADIAREPDYPPFQLREFDSPPDGVRYALMADGQ
uniref:RNase H type-1 domain-containing protein n=1 Tax=Lotus japonicus TaxID=34305 RepID=I3SNT1_LOTJA|nr:unknown [Lotus japonicus]